jgi:hypothetical protein
VAAEHETTRRPQPANAPDGQRASLIRPTPGAPLQPAGQRLATAARPPGGSDGRTSPDAAFDPWMAMYLQGVAGNAAVASLLTAPPGETAASGGAGASEAGAPGEERMRTAGAATVAPAGDPRRAPVALAPVARSAALAAPAPDAHLHPQRHPADGHHVVQRHSSWEHRLLGDVNPATLQVITNANQWEGRPWYERLLTAGKTRLERQAAVHALQQQLDNLKQFDASPPSPSTRSWRGLTLVKISCVGGDEVATYGEVNTLADYFGSLTQLQAAKKELVHAILQTVRKDSWEKLHGVLGRLDPAVARGEREPTFSGAVDTSAQAAGYMDVRIQHLTERLGQRASQRYMSNVSRNACHFAPQSWYKWKEYHEQAEKKALAAHSAKVEAAKKGNTSLTHAAEGIANDALLANGFGDHYLEDSYAAGHLINKTLIMQWFVDWAGRNGPSSKATAPGGGGPGGGGPGGAPSGPDASPGALFLKDWDKIKRMRSSLQPGIAGIKLYSKDPALEANDPQTAEDEPTPAAQMARTGLRGPDQAQDYAGYLAMLDNAAIQKAAGLLHDKFCREGLVVMAGGTPVGKVFGDEHMIEGGTGVGFSAETARQSRQRISDLATSGSSSISVAGIMARFPDRVSLKGAAPITLEEWHTGGKLRALCESEIFPQVDIAFLGSSSVAMGGTVHEGMTPEPESSVTKYVPELPIWKYLSPEWQRRLGSMQNWALHKIDALTRGWVHLKRFASKVKSAVSSAAHTAWGYLKRGADWAVSAGRSLVSRGESAARAVVDTGRSLAGRAMRTLESVRDLGGGLVSSGVSKALDVGSGLLSGLLGGGEEPAAAPHAPAEAPTSGTGGAGGEGTEMGGLGSAGTAEGSAAVSAGTAAAEMAAAGPVVEALEMLEGSEGLAEPGPGEVTVPPDELIAAQPQIEAAASEPAAPAEAEQAGAGAPGAAGAGGPAAVPPTIPGDTSGPF